MPTRIEHSVEFEHPVDQVFSEFTDEDALRRRLGDIGGDNAELLEHTESASGVSYSMRQGIPAEKLPSAMRSLISGDLMVHREQRWERATDGAAGSWIGSGKASVTGIPGSITVQTELVKAEAGTALRVKGQVKVGIPLIGGKIERTVAEQVVRLLNYENGYVADQLSGHA